ncbi:hypothetical protein JCM19233_2459 [Vibrio astriarenae]|nr:hypothetical protein JCM19233_2459 [Vibrio sp. C7]
MTYANQLRLTLMLLNDRKTPLDSLAWSTLPSMNFIRQKIDKRH